MSKHVSLRRAACALTVDTLGERILQNEELMRRIVESAAITSEPMTVQEFLLWLASVKEEDTEQDVTHGTWS